MKEIRDPRAKTYRKNFVSKALVPNIVYEQLKDLQGKNLTTVLDFGCGVDLYWPNKFREADIPCDGYDLSLSNTTRKDLLSSYCVIMVSNVLNVQAAHNQLAQTLRKILSFAARQSLIIWNYPPSPRKLDLTNEEMIEELRDMIWQEGADCQTREIAKNVYETIIL